MSKMWDIVIWGIPVLLLTAAVLSAVYLGRSCEDAAQRIDDYTTCVQEERDKFCKAKGFLRAQPQGIASSLVEDTFQCINSDGKLTSSYAEGAVLTDHCKNMRSR